MDPFTHGLVGAAATQSLADSKSYRQAAAIGFFSAMLADLDYFIHNPSDPLLNIEIHRQFTHSLIFIPAGALVAAGILWWFFRKKLSFRKIYLFSLVSYGTAGILDSFTSYGTELLWPFIETRFAWNLISVVDPLFTLGVLTIVCLSFYHRSKPIAWIAWGWILIYLTFGFVQRERATAGAYELANQRGHQVEKITVKPTIGNILLWRSVYAYGDQIYADGIRMSPFTDPVFYHGESSERIYPAEHYDNYMASLVYFDIMRFYRLSDGYLVQHPDKPGVIGDARFSMLPTSITPLWGIQADTTRPEEHVSFHYFRDSGPEVRRQFWQMLTGREQDQARLD